MKHLIYIIAALMIAAPANAACYVDYKAKRTYPLKLHYGVMKISNGDCAGLSGLRSTVSARLTSNGWQLLNILSTFDETGLSARKGNAGEFYLKY